MPRRCEPWPVNRNATGQLPTRPRTLVLALFGDEPKSYTELSRITGIPVGAVGPTRARLLRQLRVEYERVDPASARRTRADPRINAATIEVIVDDASDTS